MNCLHHPRNRRYATLVLCLATIALACLRPQIASADRRLYVWSYGYGTTFPSEMEMEHTLTSTTLDAQDPGTTSWEQRIELEVGLTRHWDFAYYQIFSQPADGSFHYDAFQIRSRIRFGEAGRWPVDPLIYLEYRRSSRFTEPHEFEAKLVLERGFKRVNAALNLTEEVVFAPGVEFETAYSAGVSVQLHPIISLAAEAFGDLAGEDAKAHYLGPTVSISMDRWFFDIGAGIGLNSASADVKARAMVGIEF